MDTKRLILFVIFSFSILMLWESWQRERLPEPQQVAASQPRDASVPQAVTSQAGAQNELPAETGFKLESDKRVKVETDLFKAEIDTMGGDLRRLELKKHRAANTTKQDFVLMEDQPGAMVYVAQSGLIGNNLPNHKKLFTASADSYQLKQGQDWVEVRLSWTGQDGVQVDKVYTFHRGSYVIDLAYQIRNNSNQALHPSVYYQIVHDSESQQGPRMMPTFTGGAYFTQESKYTKIPFKTMAKENLLRDTRDGWIGLVQHYFVSAWIPKEGLPRVFYTRKLSDNIYSIGTKSALGSIAPGTNYNIEARLYAGPQTQKILKATAPGLEYTVDYGWLTIIATPLFWILSSIEKLVHNWGVAIILLTVLIKLAFYPLSATSYRSMAHMRELAPRLQRMKEQYGDDRQKFQQAMIELYRKEKINPMGGCLPIVVQIPVFIALYWVLLGSIELRHAPFMLWINDLSAPDPYYVLPILMGITMIVQTRLNPTPPDPVQAKVMMIMPVVFSVFFFFFPAGLVLYWLVNNILSISQQWYVNRSIAEAAARKKGHAAR
ncbi:MAG TPA: membrane protein insertase YidC [Methylophilaceae bacterium]|nr:membrane protein insertase YidC [Methylophilaceae bacterium]